MGARVSATGAVTNGVKNGATAVKNGVGGIFSAIYVLIDKAPTTNLRILFTLMLTGGTAIKYWSSDTWVPAWAWLVFLAGMAGLDVWQHLNKRKTQWHPATLNGSVTPEAEEGADEDEREEEIG